MKPSILLILAVVIAQAAAWKLDKDFLKMDWAFGKNSVSLKLEADFEKMSKSLAVQWRVNDKTECPSFVLWWDKSEVKYPSLSVTAGCKNGEKEPIMRWDLIGDWDRSYDKIEEVDGVKKFMFQGVRKFEKSIADWTNSYRNLNNLKAVFDGKKREEHSYKI